MARRSSQDWQVLVTEQAMSGLSAAAFCRSKNLNAKYFSLRKTQLSKQTSAAFIPIQLSAPTSPDTIRIDWQDTSVVLPVSLSPGWVADFVKQLSL
ncbi:MAG: IS66 family insertion sequence element accessory protein TnpB [Candidatus Thiodiazotropha lotti]|uniref:IS66 family insertion sequence element accessory protein TnpB n=1 Tax=Candidatus Thiodiazotropha lotti TaxID=2792787 RepID=A0A9E4K9X4_9GAMM|nr:IS66 family insertion sequence element accessory protein TnpB [Candidatus Thiodiazotropha lotti]MCW4205635.1 IS66 family insertion sequence element accessory protein TnpB [Candidatus Thiodiazotropha lotti]